MVSDTLAVSRTFERQDFSNLRDHDSARTFANLEFHRCRFLGCGLSITRDPALRSTIRNVRLTNCEASGTDIDAAILEDVVVDGLRTHGLFMVWGGTTFKHVTLRGRIGRLLINDFAQGYLPINPTFEKLFADVRARHYEQVDWALDLSEAEFEGEVDIRSVPARLIRRDPASQAVVTRSKASAGTWRKLALNETWEASLEGLLRDYPRRPLDETVLVAPKRHPRYQDYLAGIELLRQVGVADAN